MERFAPWHSWSELHFRLRPRKSQLIPRGLWLATSGSKGRLLHGR